MDAPKRELGFVYTKQDYVNQIKGMITPMQQQPQDTIESRLAEVAKKIREGKL